LCNQIVFKGARRRAVSLIKITKPEKTEALTIRMPESVIRELRSYMAFLKTDSTRETLGAMILYVTSRDREFQNFKKQGGRHHDNFE